MPLWRHRFGSVRGQFCVPGELLATGRHESVMATGTGLGRLVGVTTLVVAGDPHYERTHPPRGVVAGSGREFVLAHVPAEDHLPEPELGYSTGPPFWDWKLTVAGKPRALTSDDVTPGIYTGSVIVVNVPL